MRGGLLDGIFLSLIPFFWIKYSEPRLILHVILVYTSGSFWKKSNIPTLSLLEYGIGNFLANVHLILMLIDPPV